jgi:hypothetical protein
LQNRVRHLGSLVASPNFQRDLVAARDETRRKLGLPSATSVETALEASSCALPLAVSVRFATIADEFVTQTTLYRWSIALLLGICSLLLSAAPQSTHAQSAAANVSGIITDAKGGVLQNATISIKNEATGYL